MALFVLNLGTRLRCLVRFSFRPFYIPGRVPIYTMNLTVGVSLGPVSSIVADINISSTSRETNYFSSLFQPLA